MSARAARLLPVSFAAALCVAVAAPGAADEPEVAEIRAEHRDGQTFVTWRDAAQGEAGKAFRYRLLRADAPITAENADRAEVAIRGILWQSGKQFGYAFNEQDRLDPEKPTAVIRAGGDPLPVGSGLAVRTVTRPGKSWYAVLATDPNDKPVGSVVPGKSATVAGIDETVAPLAPIQLGDGRDRGRYASLNSVTGKEGLPLTVVLHASQGQGGGPSDHGDLYYYWANRDMGWRDGLPGYLTVHERRFPEGNHLFLQSRDAIEHPSGTRALETYWFGYFCVPQGADHAEPRAYPFTERRMLWLIDWTAAKYQVDRERIYAGGGSMGAWGSTTFALRHPEIFAAVHPDRPRTRQRGLPSLVQRAANAPALMDDGRTDYFERMDMVRFVAGHPADLPFFGWACGRRDGFASWQEQIDMVRALTRAHHGFAFSWNDGDHSSGSQAMAAIRTQYPPERFARNRSYPAFGRSSLDDDLGNGDPKDGDPAGGINLGFEWTDVVDEEFRWSASIRNTLAKQSFTVDVTPRRCQSFKPRPDEPLEVTVGTMPPRAVRTDSHGLATAEQLPLPANEATRVTFVRKR